MKLPKKLFDEKLNEYIGQRFIPSIQSEVKRFFLDAALGTNKISIEMFGDKLLEITLDGKKYIFIALRRWNIEKPLMGWMGDMNGDDDDDDYETTLAYGEDGKVCDELHGEMVYSFYYNKDGLKPQEGHNIRLITVTPEQRQKLVEAYHSYLKKHKKDKKK